MKFTLKEWNTIQGLLIVRRNELQKMQDNATQDGLEELAEKYKKDKWRVQGILDKLEQEEI